MSNTQLLINQLQDISTRGSLSTAYSLGSQIHPETMHLLHRDCVGPWCAEWTLIANQETDLTGMAHSGGATCLGGVLLHFKAEVTVFAKLTKDLHMAELVVFFITLSKRVLKRGSSLLACVPMSMMRLNGSCRNCPTVPNKLALSCHNCTCSHDWRWHHLWSS